MKRLLFLICIVSSLTLCQSKIEKLIEIKQQKITSIRKIQSFATAFSTTFVASLIATQIPFGIIVGPACGHNFAAFLDAETQFTKKQQKKLRSARRWGSCTGFLGLCLMIGAIIEHAKKNSKA